MPSKSSLKHNNSTPPQPPGTKIARRYIIDLLKRYGLQVRRSIGQHFLINDRILHQIVDACQLAPETAVVEIGPGIGNLTSRLAEKAGTVIALELDESFRELHQKMAEAYPGLSFNYGDAMDWNWDAMPPVAQSEDIVIAGNIPYQISSPLINCLLASRIDWRAVVFTTQLEVAQRICATPGPKNYGTLSLKTALLCEAEILFNLSPKEFYPRPRVDSAVIRLTRKKNPAITDHQARKRFFKFADGLFAHRRKQAPNSLSQAGVCNMNAKQWSRLFEQCGFAPTIRGEVLNLEEALAIYHAAEKLKTEN